MPAKHGVSLSKIVLDVLKPHTPPLVEFVKEIASVKGLERIDATIVEVDTETDTVKLVVEGNDIDLNALNEAIRKTGAVVHSVDEVVAIKTSLEKK